MFPVTRTVLIYPSNTMFANSSDLLFGGFLAVVDVAAPFRLQAGTDVNKPAKEFPSFKKENV